MGISKDLRRKNKLKAKRKGRNKLKAGKTLGRCVLDYS